MEEWVKIDSEGQLLKWNPETSRLIQLTDTERREVAKARDRVLAASVIIPRVFGAVECYGEHDRDIYRKGRSVVVDSEDDFQILMYPQYSGLSYQVIWRERTVFSLDLDFDAGGSYLDGRIAQKTWLRSAEWSRWQSALFDVFDRDSYSFLAAPLGGLPALAARLLKVPIWGRSDPIRYVNEEKLSEVPRAGAHQARDEQQTL